MHERARRRTVWIATALAVLTFCAPAIARTSKKAPANPGSIQLIQPQNTPIVSGPLTLQWVWHRGTDLTSMSKIDIYHASAGSGWQVLASAVSVRAGAFIIDTSSWADGLHFFRLYVVGKKLHSLAPGAFVDNHAPTLSVTSPQTKTLTVHGTPVDYTTAIGVTPLDVDITDGAGSGVPDVKVVWSLDGAEIATGAHTSYDFGQIVAGEHVLSVTAADLAGNTTTSPDIALITAPFVSALEPFKPSPQPLPVDSINPALPSPPDVPAVPDVVPSDVPTSAPTDVPVPTDVPSAPPATIPG